jgi:opacity protein-like surface antigen
MKAVFLFALISSTALWAQGPGRWSANIGAGPAFGVGDAGDRVNTGFNVSAGAGFNFSQKFGIMLDYTYNDFGLSDKALSQVGAPDGFAHVWGFSAEPVYRIAPDRKVGGYVLGGYGVFTRTVGLTRPGLVPAIICDPWTFICYSGATVADIIYRSNSITKGGWNLGGGLTYRLGESKANLYVEFRYFDVLTNNVDTTFLPMTVGLRW